MVTWHEPASEPLCTNAKCRPGVDTGQFGQYAIVEELGGVF